MKKDDIVIVEIANLKKAIEELRDLILSGQKEILTIEEAANYVGYKKGTLYIIMSAGEIPYYKRGRKAYFKRSELDEWMMQTRVKTESEIRTAAADYILKH